MRTAAVNIAAWALVLSLLAAAAAGAAWILGRGLIRIAETAPQLTVPAVEQPAPAAPPPPAPEREVDGVMIRNPSWAVRPIPEYPMIALNDGVEGEAILRCESLAEGWIGACRTVSETPEGYGFAAAADRAAREARLHPRTLDGFPTDGEVQFVIRFRLP